ncbi:MAG: hypothetical protein JSV03_05645 [Planctomycetota bacterium]|nr:MAG: hypothetical protein JSV03_05645 [Planctomycetota bacterium]
MQNEERLTPPECELEEVLGNIKPAGTSIDRDLLMFRAGQSSARHRSRVWQFSTGLLIIVLCWSLWSRPMPETIERTVYVKVDQPGQSKAKPPAASLATLEWRVNGKWHELKLD